MRSREHERGDQKQSLRPPTRRFLGRIVLSCERLPAGQWRDVVTNEQALRRQESTAGHDDLWRPLATPFSFTSVPHAIYNKKDMTGAFYVQSVQFTQNAQLFRTVQVQAEICAKAK